MSARTRAGEALALLQLILFVMECFRNSLPEAELLLSSIGARRRQRRRVVILLF